MNFVTRLGAIFAMSSLLFGCSTTDESPDYEKIADAITEKTAKKMKKEKNLYLIGTGGRMMNDIQMMHIGFNFYRIVELKEARELIVYVVDNYLSEINNNEKIRPYLHKYPFTAKNIEVDIYFHQPNGSNVLPKEISIASACNGEIKYYRLCPGEYPIKSFHEETYEEALQLVKNETSD